MADESKEPAILKPVFGVFAIIGWLILMGLHVVWHYSFGWLFTTLADLLDRVSIPTGFFGRRHLFGTVSAWLRSLDRNVDNALVHAANGLEHSAVWLFSRVGAFFGWVAGEVKTLALTVEHAVRKLITVTIPRLIHKALRLVWQELRGIIRYARKMVKWLVHELAAFKRAIWKMVKWELHQLGKFGRSLLHTIKGIAANFAKVWKRLNRVEQFLAGKGFRNLLAGGLTGLGLGWLFLGDVARVAKWIALQGTAAVIEFVRDTLDFLVDVDICALISFAYDVAVIIEPIFHDLVGATEWICRHQGERLPSAVPDTPGYDKDWYPSGTVPPDAHPRLAPGFNLPVLLRPVN